MRARGINYDTGFFDGTRVEFDPAVVRRELGIIARDLHCTAVRVSGGDPERLSIAGAHAIDEGLELWFAPFPCDMTRAQMLPYFRDCARRAETLRERSPDVVLVVGCELSLFADGFMPGDGVLDRIARAVEGRSLRSGSAVADVSAQLNAYLAEVTAAVREDFGGRVTYASGKWEVVDWTPFDLVAVDLYREEATAEGYVEQLRGYRRHGKPVAITEFGCCTFRGAAARGGTGWMIVDSDAEPPRLRDTYVRDEAEQAALLRELLDLYAAEDVDSAFWFTFASYTLPHRPDDPLYDLDLGAYGVVKMLEDGVGRAYPDMRWEPKQSFHALAETYARLAAA